MLKAAIFDLNGIFIQSPKLSDRFEQIYGVPTSTFMPKLLEIMDKVRQPDAGSAFTYWEPVLREWGVELTEAEFWDFWFGAEKVSDRMVEFARELRAKGIKVFILSNNFKERAQYYGNYPWIHDAVDKLYFSWQTGFVKPDTRAWSLVLEENGLDPADCIYFDDQQKNLKAAESVGIPAHLFTNEEELEKMIHTKI
ncbi:MAG: HAD family phosphatase [Patescibacteria group bacterium]